MSSHILCEEPYAFVAFVQGGLGFLTFMSGGPMELDYTVQLQESEVAAIKGNSIEARKLVTKFKADAALLNSRKLEASIWPQ